MKHPSSRTLSLLLCTLCVGALLSVSACAQSDAQSDEAAPPALSALVVGGDQHHDFDRWFDVETTRTLAATGADVEYTDVPGRIPAALEELDVLYLSNNQPLPGTGLRDSILHHVAAGKGLMIGHAAAWYSWADWPAYNRDLVGGGTRSHRDYGEFEVRVIAPEHPIMQGVPETFVTTDELYRFEKDADGPSLHVLAEAEEPETGEVYPIVWIVDNTKGRIVVNTLGHDGATHEHPAYQRIQQNTLRWAGRRID